MNSRWKQYLLYASLIFLGGSLLYILIETVRVKNTGFETKTLWDWMDLLIIPMVLAIGAFYLNRSERAVERQIAEERAKLERQIATDRQREAALQSYLDRMTDLLLNEKLRTTKKREVRDIARVRTLTVLRGLDGIRKRIVVSFLLEAGLISLNKPVINLLQADLRGVDLSWGIFNNANLSYALMSDVNLYHTILVCADLSGADLSNANLTGANLQGANLRDSMFIGAILTGADFKGAIMPDGTKHE